MNGEVEETQQKQNKLPFFGIGLAILFAAGAFFSGVELGSRHPSEANLGSIFFTSEAQQKTDLTEFWKVWDLLDDKFVAASTTKPITDEDKLNGAIAGLVSAFGDPYTMYFPPADAEIFEGDISGNFGGVGMEVGMRENVVTVIAPLPDSPAKAAGIQSGDAIIKIDGVTTEGMGVDEAVKKIRGEKGTEVALTLVRKDVGDLIEVKVVRDTINIPTIKTERKDGVFIIALYNFSAISEAKMSEALREFIKSGDKKLVLDLRGNPGGYLQSAVNIASYFLPAGKVVVRENYDGDTEEDAYRSTGRDLHAIRDFKMAVLIDGGSASASEILAGALGEHNVAKLVGAQSFGKGSVQELVSLDTGSSLKVTIARWFTPNGVSISKNGLTPDFPVEFKLEDREANRDPQMDAALKYLNE